MQPVELRVYLEKIIRIYYVAQLMPIHLLVQLAVAVEIAEVQADVRFRSSKQVKDYSHSIHMQKQELTRAA